MNSGATLNPQASSGISIGCAVGSVADWLRRVTVCIQGPKGARGSGVIFRDGLIITNAHVAVGRTQSIEFFDGTKSRGTLLARDPERDLAAVAVAPGGFESAVMRSARELRPGEMVIAIGNPWDGAGAVSAGILHKAAPDQHVLFADIRLAPGNSGGPLADAQGRVVGVNCAVSRGLGCAVTSDAVKNFLLRSGLLEAA
jgi:serine protease Do